MSLDAEILLWINGHHAEWADLLMWYISKSATWIPLYALMIAVLWYRFGWRRMLVWLVAIVVAVGLSDFLSSGVIKPLVCRLRPTHEPQIQSLVHLVNGYQGGLYGFVSSHAANTVACAFILSRICRDWRVTLIMSLYVLLNCYSRMYLGVHYPGDILGGLTVGLLVAECIYLIARKVDAKLQNF